MHCNGKCYLAKQLKEQQKQEQAPTAKKDKTEVILFISQEEGSPCAAGYSSIKKYFTPNDVRLVSFPRSVFHPPAA